MRKNRILRNIGIPIYRLYARNRVDFPPPKIFINSLPKAGTHLVMELLNHVPSIMFSGRHLVSKDIENENDHHFVDSARIKKYLNMINNGQYITAHIPYIRELSSILENESFKVILVFRDPRDIALSHANYVTNESRHFLHKRYTTLYKDQSERILASIQGFRKDKYGPGLESIGDRIRNYVLWMNSNVYLTRFEDLIGEKGEGNRGRQLDTIRQLLNYLNRPQSEGAINQLCDKIWSPKSATFNKGKIGSWKDYFNEEHVDSFKKIAGKELIELGYEKSMEWYL